MLVRIFVGSGWAAAQAHGDYVFDVLPAAGHKLAFATDTGWQAAIVIDVAHRFVDHGAAADIALLLSPLMDGDDRDAALPLAQFDRLGGAPGAGSAATPATGPWSGR